MDKALRLGIIGAVLNYSKSPQIHNAALKFLALDGKYESFEIEESRFNYEIKTVLIKNDGLNVTIPYKETMLRYLNKLDPLVKRIGATNTLVISSNGIHGYNTDYYGFIDSLENENLNEKTVSILGSGGASKALIIALEDLGVSEIFIYARNTNKAESSLPETSKTKVTIKQFSNIENLSHSQLIINTTPLGQGRLENAMPLEQSQIDLLRPNTIIYDLIYSKTKLLQEAKKRDLKIIDGSQMLILQAAKSLEIWTEQKISKDVIKVMTEAFYH